MKTPTKAILFFLILILPTVGFAKVSKDASLCNLLQNEKAPYGLIVDSKTGKELKNIDFGEIKQKINQKFIAKSFRLIVTPQNLIPHQILMADIKFNKSKPVFRCKSSTEYLATLYLPTYQLTKGKFSIDYLIDLEDPEAEEPMLYVYTIKSKLTGTFISNE